MSMNSNLERRLRGEITSITTDPEADLWSLRKEAANEIANLRSEAAAADVFSEDVANLEKTVEARDAEIARLRAVLETHRARFRMECEEIGYTEAEIIEMLIEAENSDPR